MKKGWEIKKLGEVCELMNGYAFQSKQYTDEGYFVIRIGNVQDGYIELNNSRYIKLKEDKQKKFILHSGDILISLTGNVGRVGVIQEEHLPAVLNQRVAKIAIRKEQNNNKEYLLYFLSSEYFISELIKAGRGAAQQNISTTDIESLEIPLPPLPEQHSIVAILDEAFTAIAKVKANAEQNLQNAKELFDSYLQGVFEGGNWETKELAEICEISSKLIDPQKTEFQNLIHIGAGNIESKKGTLLNLKTAKEENLISGKFLFDESMILYSKIRPYLMKVVNCEFKGLCSADIYPIVPIKGKIIKDYLYHLLLTKDFTDYAILGSQRAGMPKVNREHLFSYNLQLPSINEQQVIVQKLDAIISETIKLEATYKQKINDLEELKKSILQKAFCGELKTNAILI